MSEAIKKTNSCILCGYNPEKQCSYFRFPKKESRRKEWLSLCNLSVNQNVDSARLCSSHFQAEDFRDSVTKYPRLKNDAAPTIFFESDARFSRGRPGSEPEEDREKEEKSDSKVRIRYCAVCRVNTMKPTARFPQKERDKWSQHFNINPKVNLKNAYMCVQHFIDESIPRNRRNSRVSMLLREAECGGLIHENEATASVSTNSSSPAPEGESRITLTTTTDEVSMDVEYSADTPVPPNSTVTNNESGTPCTPPSVNRISGSSMAVTPIKGSSVRFQSPRYPGDIRTPHLETPRRAKRCVELAKRCIRDQKSRIESLQQQLRRARKKIKSLEDIVTKLREDRLVNEDMKETLMNIMPPVVGEMSYRKLRNQKEKYSVELRKFALTLQFYSPKGYSYVRKTFSNLLPHPATIRKWCCTEDGQPGFSKEVMQTIQSAHTGAKDPRPIVCNLVLDEMSIRQMVQVRNNRTYGHVDLGFTEDGEELQCSGTPPTAKQALVFLLVSLNDSWKCPCGYFLIDSLASEQRAGLMKKALALLSEHNINVHSLTFDGQQVNMSTVKVLGGNLDVHSKHYQPYFIHPTTSQKVWVFPDACHMLKNVRNAFGNYGILEDGRSRKILWSDITRSVDIQENEIGLRIANKLTKRHINFKQNIMNVRLATQTLSNSTKDSLLYLKESKKYGREFQSVDGTAEFCKKINDAFDLLNCRSRFRQRFETHKIPISQTREIN